MKHKHHRFAYLLIGLIGLSSSSIQAQTIPTLNEIKTRQEELKEPEKNIPDNQIVLSDELRRVDEESRDTGQLRTFTSGPTWTSVRLRL
jgi:streptogramin lyase